MEGNQIMQYTVQDPQGNTRIIEGPDGASDEEVISQAQKLFGQSGGMPQRDTLDAVRQHIDPRSYAMNAIIDKIPLNYGIKSIARDIAGPVSTPINGNGFEQDINNGGAQSILGPIGTALVLPTAVENPLTRSVGETVGTALDTVAGGTKNRVLKFLQDLKLGREAPTLVGNETPIEAGNIVEQNRLKQEAARYATSNSLYAKAPKDTTLPISVAPDKADSLVNTIKEAPPGFEPSSDFLKKLNSVQSMNKASVGSIQTMQSAFRSIATNGSGVEKIYAKEMVDALQQDLENFASKPVLNPSNYSAPVMEEGQIGDKVTAYVKGIQKGLPSKGIPDIPIYSVKGDPNVLQTLFGDSNPASVPLNVLKEKGIPIPGETPAPLATTALTNSDIPQNLKIANSYYRDIMDLKNSPLSKALEKAPLEAKANVIFKGGRVDDINTAKALLGDEGYNAAQGQFYQKIIKSGDIQKALGKYSPEFLQQAFTPQQLQALNALHTLQKAALGLKATTLASAIASAGYYAVKSAVRKALPH